MNAPVSGAIIDLFEKYGVDTNKHADLISDLMHYVYDQMDVAVDKVFEPIDKMYVK
jgi:hypothetical protein